MVFRRRVIDPIYIILNRYLFFKYLFSIISDLFPFIRVTDHSSKSPDTSSEDIFSPYSSVENSQTYERDEHFKPKNLPVKLLAFYLPQYHPFPENDRFWGKGFTEWTNTTKALPLFEEHYQPKLPGELGFYDTRLKVVLQRQIELAKQHGIYGFCFHHYFFHGRKVMRVPLNQILEYKDLDMPFCLHWANEPWTARFDGWSQHGDVLIEQRHDPQDDINFFQDILPALQDERYIKCNERPLLLIYRPGLFPNFNETVQRWKTCCVEAGIKDLFLVMVETDFEKSIDPRTLGFDAAVEFPPLHSKLTFYKEKVTFIKQKRFTGQLYNYKEVVNGSLERNEPPYLLFRGIMPSWDNTARRKDPSIFLGASPETYQEWLEKLCNYTLKSLPHESQFIFINAWNEWAEGTYLEPDRKYGYAYLNATSRALKKVSNSLYKNDARGKILFISHDASVGGAQSVLLSLLTWIKNNTNIVIKVILIKSGELTYKFREIADVTFLNDITSRTRSSTEIFKEVFDFCNGRPDLIYGNTVVAGKLYPILKYFAVPIITHVHEMQNSIDIYAKDFIKSTINHSSHFIACSSAVAENLMQSYNVSLPDITTIYAFIQSETNHIVPDEIKKDLRIKLGLNPDNFIVYGAGLGLFWRKGADLFIEIAAYILKSGITNIKFYWLGEFDYNSSNEIYGSWKNISKRIINYGLEKNIYFLGVKENVKEFFKAGDVFILPSREDPFPLVCLEAAQNSLPVVCFADAGGMPEFVEDDAGFVVPFGDTQAMAKAILDLYYQPKLRKQLGERAQVKINERHIADIAAPQILSCCRKVSALKPEVSIIVPNYNYAKYLEKRLTSIINQSFKDFELIILDDGSVDDSLKIIDNFRKYPQVQVHVNCKNSGSVFSQWYSGISKAKGELIWIAEADDYSNEYFLEQMLPFFDNPEVVLAYCSSHVVDENDQIFENFYINCGYYNKLPGAKKWNKNYINNGLVELNDGLAIINTIPNASAVIFRKSNFLKINKEELINFRCGGDWYSYINMLGEGYIAYLSKPFNYHRRHKESVVEKNLLTASETISDYFKIHKFIIQHFNIDKIIIEQQWKAVFIDLHKFWPELSDDEYSKLYDKASLVKQFELKQGF